MKPQGIYGFFCELRRRKVYRVAAAYAVGAWVAIQVAATVFNIFALPTWGVRLVVALVLAGFPIALLLAWAFDLGPSGLTKTVDEPADSECPPALVPRRRNVIALIIVGVTIAAVAAYFLMPGGSAAHLEKSIAVLPFDNFTADKENEFFADGIQDDVLTSLSKIGDLKVISRSSVMNYRGQPRNVRAIGKALGVATLLEGSVRRKGNQVRVNVQLINASNERQIWAQGYDRNLPDAFAMQSELAQEIASQLHATLSPAEQVRIEERPTANREAYRLYQQARDISSRPEETLEVLKRAEQLYEKATELDPAFALAHARLAQLHGWIYYLLEPTPERRNKAATSAREAIRLQPNLPESHLALGYSYYYGERDYAHALAEFEIARHGLPNEPGVFRALASIQRRQGKWKEAIANFEKASSLSPGDPDLLENLALTYEAVRDFPAAAKAFDRAIALVPKSFEANSLRARIDLEWTGDLGRMKKLLAMTPDDIDSFGSVTLARFNVHFFERDFKEALAVLWRSPLENLHGQTSTPLPKSFLAGQVFRLLPDPAKARESYEHALGIAERAIEESPQDSARHSLLGLIYAGLGRREEAVREGERALLLLPESKDALDGPVLVVSLARIYAIVGSADKAIDLLEHSLTTPAGITVPELRLDPTWDALRANARFNKLVK